MDQLIDVTNIKTSQNNIDLTLEQLLNPSPNVRFLNLKKLREVVNFMVASDVRQIFIPFLQSLEEDDENVCMEIVILLNDLVDIIGGIEFVDCLFSMIYKVCESKHKSIQQKAFDLLYKILNELPSKFFSIWIDTFCTPFSLHTDLIIRLEAIHLIIKTIEKITHQGDIKLIDKLIKVYSNFLSDSEIKLRRSFLFGLKEFAKVIKLNQKVSNIFKIWPFEILSDLDKYVDDLEPLQIISSNVLFELCEEFPEMFENDGHSILLSNLEGISWRVRCGAIDVLSKFSKILSAEKFNKIIVPEFITVLSDTHIEVRACSLKHAFDIFKHTNDKIELLEIISQMIDKNLENQESQLHITNYIELLLIELITNLSTFEEAHKFISQHFELLICSNDLSVITKLLEKLQILVKNLGLEKIYSKNYSNPPIENFEPKALKQELPKLISNPNWRIRHSLFKILHILLDTEDINHDDYLYSSMINALLDSVLPIRSAAIGSLCMLYKDKNEDWLTENVIPILEFLKEEPNYEIRICFLHFLQKLLLTVNWKFFFSNFQIWCEELSNDKISNVRLNVLKTIYELRKRYPSSTFYKSVKHIVEKLATDPDNDVKHFANLVLSENKIWPEYPISEI